MAFVRLIFVGAVISWLAAAAVAVLANGWRPGTEPLQVYAWELADAVGYALVAAGLAALAVAMWRGRLWMAYLPAALLVPIGTGGRLVLGDDPLGEPLAMAVGFAALLLLNVEFLSAQKRFAGVVQSMSLVSAEEARPAARYLLRYSVMVVALVGLYAALLILFVGQVLPLLTQSISTRMSEGLEVRTALGVVAFSLLVLALPLLGRMLYEGIRDRVALGRAKAAEEAAEGAA